MLNINEVKKQLSKIYFDIEKTTERYNLIHELQEFINELKKTPLKSELKDEELTQLFLDRFQRIISEQCGTKIDVVEKTTKLETTFREIVFIHEFDSLDQVELIMALEEEFDLSIPDHTAEAMYTDYNVSNFLSYVVANGGH